MVAMTVGEEKERSRNQCIYLLARAASGLVLLHWPSLRMRSMLHWLPSGRGYLVSVRQPKGQEKGWVIEKNVAKFASSVTGTEMGEISGMTAMNRA